MDLHVGVLTVSDRVSAGQMDDEGGPAVEAALLPHWQVVERSVVPDDIGRIVDVLRRWTDANLDVVFTTGGTGLGPRDVTPEATLKVAPRIVPGIAELMRARGLQQTPHAMLSRAAAAVAGTTLVINLPGSPRGAREGVETVSPVLEHAVATIRGARH